MGKKQIYESKVEHQIDVVKADQIRMRDRLVRYQESVKLKKKSRKRG